jgi:hypothetical protein
MCVLYADIVGQKYALVEMEGDGPDPTKSPIKRHELFRGSSTKVLRALSIWKMKGIPQPRIVYGRIPAQFDK